MIVDDAESIVRPRFFLLGFRAPPGGQGGPDADQVGVGVVRSVLSLAGVPAADCGKVLTEDIAFDDVPEAGPFRFESEIAPVKPQPDVVVVDDLDHIFNPTDVDDPSELEDPDFPALLAGRVFGSIALRPSGGVFGPNMLLNFGWLPRALTPRVEKAGLEGPDTDPGSLLGFDPEQYDLPKQFDNAFYNGRPLAGPTFGPGDQLRFTDNAGPTVTLLTIPAAPLLTVTRDGEPLEPPLTLTPRVDTIVMDRGAGTFTLVWRATFPWNAAYEGAKLEVA